MKPSPSGDAGSNLRFACNRKHMTESVAQNILDCFGFAKSRNAEARLGHQVRDAGIVGAKQNQMSGDAAGVQFIQLMLAVSHADGMVVPDHLSLRQ